VWVALLPAIWLFVCTMTAGWQKIFSDKIGFFAAARNAKTSHDALNNTINGTLTAFFMVVVVVLAIFSIRTAMAALKKKEPSIREVPYEPLPANWQEQLVRGH
ncbi:hypothetical protein RUW10_22850, partial [Bacillus sp. IG2]|nr:hypothetical protein [Bacillus sp. IG2]